MASFFPLCREKHECAYVYEPVGRLGGREGGDKQGGKEHSKNMGSRLSPGAEQGPRLQEQQGRQTPLGSLGPALWLRQSHPHGDLTPLWVSPFLRMWPSLWSLPSEGPLHLAFLHRVWLGKLIHPSHSDPHPTSSSHLPQTCTDPL